MANLYFESLVSRGMTEGRARQFANIINELHSCLCHLDTNNFNLVKDIQAELTNFAKVEELKVLQPTVPYSLEFIRPSAEHWAYLCFFHSNLKNENSELYVTVEDLEVFDDDEELIDLKGYYGITSDVVCFYR